MATILLRLLAIPLLAGLSHLPLAAAPGSFPQPSEAVRGLAPFHPNGGQFPGDVLFAGRSGDTAILVGKGAITVFRAGQAKDNNPSSAVSIRWNGAAPTMTSIGAVPSETTVSYFVGSDSLRWAANLPSFHQVRLNGLYPGIDLIAYLTEGELEFDYLVHPGSDPSQIRWTLALSSEGRKDADFVLGDDGALHGPSGGQQWSLRMPVAYQTTASGRSPVASRYFARGVREWALDLGPYDPDLPLVVDPVLNYSSYYGGTQFDQANAVAVDAANNIYLAGETWSIDLGSTAAVQSYRKSGKDAFILKLSPDARSVLNATYFGGNGDDIATAIRVWGSDVFVAGETSSGDLPGTAGRYQGSSGGGKDGFLTRISLSSTPSIQGTTYLGGSGTDRINALILDFTGNPYVVGYTTSSNFPVSGSFGLSFPGGGSDAFIARLGPDLATLSWSGFYGGGGGDQAYGLALGSGNSIWFTGSTSSATLPMVNPLQTALSGANDCFLAQVTDTGSALLYSSFLGGTSSDFCYAVSADGAGNPTVAGSSASADFPVTPGVYQPVRGGSYDNILAKLNTSTGALAFATYLGGTQSESPSSVYFDTDGAICMAGNTQSTNFPTMDPVQANFGGLVDGFLSCLNANATALLFSTFLGGAEEDRILAVARRSDSWTVAAGLTQSTNFPRTDNARQPNPTGSGDAFIAAISRGGANVNPANISVSPSNGNTETAHLTYVVEDGNGYQDIRAFYANIHNAVSTVGACYTRYDADLNQIFLLSDSGAFWVGSATMGEAKTLSNSQCVVDASRSSVWGHATRLSVRIHYSFRPGFGGPKSLLMYVQDRTGIIAGWQLRGGWTVPQLAGNVQPAVDYFQPNSGTFPSTLFVIRAVDANGANDLRDIHLLANDTLSYGNSCYVVYNQSSNQLKLLNDTTTQFLGPLTPGVSGTLENNSCILSAGYSAATKAGDALTLSVYLSFKAAAAGANTAWTLVSDQSNAFLGWRTQGSFTVPIGPAFVRPSAQSIAVTTIGTKVRFTMTGSDQNGGEDIKDFYFLANGTLSNPGGCYVLIRRISNQALLLNDAGNAWQGSGAIGANQVIENSQCRLNLMEMSTSVNGPDAQAEMDVQFKAPFSGQKSAWLYVEDSAKLASGWVFLNTFTPIAP
ncbi:MAG: hypothetical protein U5J83_11315 [Bryobacterales bacterium]|nr:hypothetical protein [Bryobacterales bacterium]